MDNISKIFPNMAAELDEDLGNVRIQLDSQQKSQEDELLEYFGRFNLEGSESTTPISDHEITLSKLEIPEKKVLDIDSIMMFNNPAPEYVENPSAANLKSTSNTNIENKSQEKAISPVSLHNQHPSDWYLKMKMNPNHSKTQTEKNKSYKSNFHELNSSIKNPTPCIGSDKWVTEKEKFLESTSFKNDNFVENTNHKENQKLGTVVVKESFIEVPRIGRISKSFHGKSPSKDSYLDIDSAPRRASDNMVNLSSTFLNSKPANLINKDSSIQEKTRPKFYTQKSQPCPVASKEEFRKSSLSEPQNLKGARFTTTLVDERVFMEGIKTSSTSNNRLSNE